MSHDTNPAGIPLCYAIAAPDTERLDRLRATHPSEHGSDKSRRECSICYLLSLLAAHPAPPAGPGEWLADALDRLLLAGEGAATAYERGARGEQVQHEREADKIKAEILDFAAALQRAAGDADHREGRATS